MRSFSALGLFCLHNPFLEPASPQKWPWRLQYVHQGVPGPLFPTEGCESCIASKDLCAYVGTWTGRGVSSCWKVQQTVLWQLSLWNQALATTTILAWLGPNLLSQRCYLVSLGQQGRHVCPVWTAEGNKCLRNSMKKLWTFHLGQLGRARDGGRNGSLWPWRPGEFGEGIVSYWEELTSLGLTAAATPRTPSTFSGLAPHCHKQPFS